MRSQKRLNLVMQFSDFCDQIWENLSIIWSQNRLNQSPDLMIFVAISGRIRQESGRLNLVTLRPP